ncbi:hypothetical protein VTH06DRAFT_7038 [Thermothelomyces fergusii]
MYSVLLASFTRIHSVVTHFWLAGAHNAGTFFPYYPAEGQSSIQRHWIDFSPIIDLNTPMVVCNNPGDYAEEYATIDAGAEIGAYYRGWPHDIGPIVVWMAYCGSEPTSCSSFNGTGKHWFKIAEAGLLSGTMREGVWAQKEMISNNYTWTVTIPEQLRSGAYLIRHELIALHVPFTPESYPECAHLYVQGSGDAFPGEEYLASIPGVWEEDEPELHLSIYEEPTASRTEWTIPGPPVWRG